MNTANNTIYVYDSRTDSVKIVHICAEHLELFDSTICQGKRYRVQQRLETDQAHTCSICDGTIIY